ncbi:MAG2-interacting protein 2 [Striga hermonthica]|uniref:MAG2-interacting protein 2 n=1 Tax=Striga hermonthica TaxID=68872 RepID=A0A9N7R5Y9_STRHE|nr:MAG2-interacting protein 2 [Striga hermonthica]
MEAAVKEVLFETRRHASRPYTSNYPPQQQLRGSGGGSLLSYLPFRGITQLRDKWSKNRQPRRSRRLVSLFVSAMGDYVAVASGNQITILPKNNDYKEPVGIFTCAGATTFTCGTWSESHELLGVADDIDTIYIIKPNGEEMTRITKRHLNASSPFLGLIVQDDALKKQSYLCAFTIFVSDGTFHDIEISKDPSASIFPTQALNSSQRLRQFPQEICCWDYHTKLSLLAIASSVGSCSISIWRKSNLEMEPLASVKFEGSYSIAKEYHGQLTSPKVLFSLHGNYVASLDFEGCLVIFQFDEETCSLSKLSDGRSCTNDISSSGAEFLHDIVDFTWWSDDVLTVLKSQWLSSAQGVHEINSIFPTIKDLGFVLFECVDKVGATEDAARALISFGLRLTDSYRFSELEDNENEQIWNFRLARLKLLQFRDRLETFVGVNMGRYSVQEYIKFRQLPIGKAALVLAESGKIGALNLLFKRHPYSLIPSMLEVLAAIPETIPVQSYGQLLPAISAPSSIVLRDEDWVECETTVIFLKNLHGDHVGSIQYMTEPVMKHMALQWPSVFELSTWYKNRAREIDTLSGQLDNCMCLVDLAIRKGVSELQQFHEDIFHLHQLIYSDETEDGISFSMSLANWEQLPDYEKFKVMMVGAKEDNVITRLHEKAIPFMQRRFNALNSNDATNGYPTQDKTVDSFLVRWMIEVATQNKLDICSIIIEEGCRDMAKTYLFKDQVELVDCALRCIYFCTDVDSWSTMSTILSKLPQLRDLEDEDIKDRLKLAEGHVEAGRLLAYYQVPKPISFFLDARSDEKGVKQIIRLLLSKFIRSQPGRSDHDWASLWRDLQSLQGKAFTFLNWEYMLIEFCRGLLTAGKFALARNYLKGTSTVNLATDKAENLVIQAAREYFFSAPTLACSEIWKAKECLSIFPSSRNVRAEADIIDAVTVRLPNLGVNLLPMAFRQIKDPMEIIKLAVTSQGGAYLNVDEIIEVAKLLGLSSQEELSTVQEAIAREAAFAGDVQLAFDLCLVLAKKGHGSIWDLCAALARSQAIESMDLKSQKLLLGFALSHCDEESIGEILQEWEDVEMQEQCETMIVLTGREPPEFSEQSSVNSGEFSERINVKFDDHESQVEMAKSVLSHVAKNLSSENEYERESILKENRKVLSFAASQLPWLLELSESEEFGKRLPSGSAPAIQYVSIRTQAVMSILSWLTRSGFAPTDNMIVSLAKSIMEPPVSDEEDFIGCSVLLNLVDAFHGAEIIEQQLKTRDNYREFSSLMNVGMIYSLLHSYGTECEDPAQRRELLLNKLQEKHRLLSSDECSIVHEAQSTFWNEWKVKLEQQKTIADKSRVLEKLIPGVDTSRFFSGDREYIQSVVFSLIESVKVEKKSILKDTLVLAHTYCLNHSKVILYYLNTILVSEVWSVDDIREEIADFKEEILAYAGEAIKTISLSVYPAIDGRDKQRLGFVYNLLSDCYMHLEKLGKLENALWLARFCKIVGQECSRVSFIEGLDFKNIASLQDLNLNSFNDEVCSQIDESNVEALATMVQNLVLLCGDTVPEGLVSWNHIYAHYVLSSLVTLEEKAEREKAHFQSSEEINSFVDEIEHTYDKSSKYFRFIEHPGISDIVLRFFTIIIPIDKNLKNFPCDSTGKECLVKLITFWLRLMNDMNELITWDISTERFYSEFSVKFLDVSRDLLIHGIISPKQCWCTAVSYVTYGLQNNSAIETFNFFRAMIFSGCGFEAVVRVFSEIIHQVPPETSLSITATAETSVDIQDLPNLYLSILDTLLQELARGSNNCQNLHYLLSSLSKTEGNLEDLKKVRLSVWERMSSFYENLQLSSNTRVYALELMQLISGQKINSDMFSPEAPVCLLQPWDGWDDLQSRNIKSETTSSDLTSEDTSSRFMSTLAALKSSGLVLSISPGLEITQEDTESVDSAVSCFLRISEFATTASHVNALRSVLAEWEGLFMTTCVNKNDAVEVSDDANSWTNDDWDEGWESFQEESAEKASRDENALSVHPLHICWATVVKKLAACSGHTDILKLLDQNGPKNSRVLLLDEDDTHGICRALLESNCFIALKLSLMLPYEAIQLQCLNAVESKLEEKGMSDEIALDYFFFILVLSSGILPKIIAQNSYGTIFYYICFLVGNFCRRAQEARVSANESKESLDFLFVEVLFPCFIAELVKAGQHILAGFLVTKFMHTNASLSLINVSGPSLRKFFEGQFQEFEERGSLEENVSFCEPLSSTVAGLMGNLGNLIQSAMSFLATDVR